VLGQDFELQLVSVPEIRMIGEEGGKLGVVTRFEEAVGDDNRNIAVFVCDASHQRYCCHDVRLAHATVELPYLFLVEVQSCHSRDCYRFLELRRLDLGIVEQALCQNHCFIHQLLTLAQYLRL
jgi:hypothetical protein